jgi:hypothetical protein
MSFGIAVFVLSTTCRYNAPLDETFLRMSKRRKRRPRSTSRAKKTPGPGRPPVHTETWSKVSVVLFDRQIQHLDRLGSLIAQRGKALNRAEIIRALIDGLIDSGMDVTSSSSEANLRGRVARRLGTPYR